MKTLKLILIMVALCCTHAFANETTFTILGPDGRLAADAVVYSVRPNNVIENGQHVRTEIEVVKIATKNAKVTLSDQRRLPGFVVVNAPGAAIGIWQYLPSGVAPKNEHGTHVLRLRKDFAVEGKVIDDKGRPVAAAELSITRFGIHTYTMVSLKGTETDLPWFTTRTDKQGRYKFRGIILQDYDWDVGASITARATAGHNRMIGEYELSFIGDGPHFTKARKHKPHFGSGPIQLRPCHLFGGTIVDAQTGEPLHEATVVVRGVAYDNEDRRQTFKCDKDGLFQVDDVAIREAAIRCPGYQSVELVPKQGWAAVRQQQQIKIALRPLVELNATVIDAISGEVPPVTIEMHYSFVDRINDDWTLRLQKGCGLTRAKEIAFGAAGPLELKLPVGTLTLVLENDWNEVAGAPYEESRELTISPSNQPDLQLKLQRHSGVLVKFGDDSQKLRRRLYRTKEKLNLLITKDDGNTNSKYVNNKPYAYLPTDNWGKHFTVKAILKHPNGDTAFATRTVDADAARWPIRIPLPPEEPQQPIPSR